MLGGLQVALCVAALDGLAQQVGRRAVGEALGDRRGRGDGWDLLPPSDLGWFEVFVVDDIVIAASASEDLAGFLGTPIRWSGRGRRR